MQFELMIDRESFRTSRPQGLVVLASHRPVSESPSVSESLDAAEQCTTRPRNKCPGQFPTGARWGKWGRRTSLLGARISAKAICADYDRHSARVCGERRVSADHTTNLYSASEGAVRKFESSFRSATIDVRRNARR